jgi:hypothetical protein
MYVYSFTVYVTSIFIATVVTVVAAVCRCYFSHPGQQIFPFSKYRIPEVMFTLNRERDQRGRAQKR